MKTRLIFSVAAAGVTAAIGTASVAVAQEGPGQAPVVDPTAKSAPGKGATGATGVAGASADTGATGAQGPSASSEQKAADAKAEAEKASKPDKANNSKGSAAEKPAPKPKSAQIKLYPHQLKHGKVRVGKRLKVTGKVIPFVAHQRVQVVLARDGKKMRKVNAKVRRVKHKPVGEFRFKTPKLRKPGSYKIRAHHAHSKKQKAASKKVKSFHVRYPDLDPGDKGPLVRLLNNLLAKQGYYPSRGSKYSSRTARALLAYRKVNKMSRSLQANGSIFKKLADHKGGFKPKHPGAGKHVETDLSRQVLVLVNHGKAQATFPISSGAPATPTIKGHFHFYRKDPGYNSIGMYYSVYFIRGYATHGYHSVPTYNASHGCLRNPIPDSKFIYNWIDLGDSIYVYN